MGPLRVQGLDQMCCFSAAIFGTNAQLLMTTQTPISEKKKWHTLVYKI